MDCTWKGEGERERGTKARGRTRAELPFFSFSNLADTDVARAASCVPLLQGTPPKYRPWLLPILASDGRRPSICRSLSLALFSPRTYSEARHAELSDSDGAPKMGVHRFRRRFGSLFTYVLQVPPPTLHTHSAGV